jgi:hypothetical protein
MLDCEYKWTLTTKVMPTAKSLSVSSVRSVLTTGITVLLKQTLYLKHYNHFHYTLPPAAENTRAPCGEVVITKKKTTSRWPYLTPWWRKQAVSRLLSVQVIRMGHVATRTTTENVYVAGVCCSYSFRSIMPWLAVIAHCTQQHNCSFSNTKHRCHRNFVQHYLAFYAVRRVEQKWR